MNLTAPQNDVALPEDVQKAIEGARNNVTVLENEAGRYRNIIGQAKEDLKGLLEKIEYNNGQLKAVETQLSSVKSQVEKEIQIRDAMVIDRNTLANEISNETKSIAAERSALDEDKRKFVDDMGRFLTIKSHHEKAVTKLENDKKAHEEKVARIKAAMNS